MELGKLKTQGFVPLLAGKAEVFGTAHFVPLIKLQADENEVFVRDFLQNLQVEVVQRKAFARASFKICELKM